MGGGEDGWQPSRTQASKKPAPTLAQAAFGGASQLEAFKWVAEREVSGFPV